MVMRSVTGLLGLVLAINMMASRRPLSVEIIIKSDSLLSASLQTVSRFVVNFVHYCEVCNLYELSQFYGRDYQCKHQ